MHTFVPMQEHPQKRQELCDDCVCVYACVCGVGGVGKGTSSEVVGCSYSPVSKQIPIIHSVANVAESQLIPFFSCLVASCCAVVSLCPVVCPPRCPKRFCVRYDN